jgi:hypothetical protein
MALQSVAGARIRFAPEFSTCQVCHHTLRVYKTETRTVITLAYETFEAQEVVLYCPSGCQWRDGEQTVKFYHSEFLAKLVAPGHVYGFDVVAKVGLLRFLECRQHQEIQTEIKRSHGLSIPESTVGDLIHQFVDLMRTLHEDKVPVLRSSLEAAGGYALHVDGTCEEGSHIHFACLIGPEPIVLWSDRIDSENAVQIRRVLGDVEKRFAQPSAVIQDLSRPIRNAIGEQWPSTPVFYCHQHFLADVGKDILGKAYNRLREALRQSEIRPELRRFLKKVYKELGDEHDEARRICQHLEDPDALRAKDRSLKGSAVAGGIAEWILAAAAGGSGRPFPYDLPHLALYLRAQRAREVLDQRILEHLKGRTPRGEKLLYRLRGILHIFLKSRALSRIARELEEANSIFIRLRAALRLGAAEPAHGMNEDGTYRSPEEMRQAEEALERLKEELRRENGSEASPTQRIAIKIVLSHMEKYWDGLFGHFLPLPDTDRHLIIQRTNNIAERFFRSVKRFGRRTTGKRRLNREVDAFSDQMLLVFNLKTPEYVEMICGSLDRLHEAFADLARRGKLPRRSRSRSARLILDRKKLRHPDFPAYATSAFAGS